MGSTLIIVFVVQGFPGLKGFPGDLAFYFLDYPGVPVSTGIQQID